MKDLGSERYCLGMEFEQLNGKVTLDQSGYIRELLVRLGMTDCNAVSTPKDPCSTKLSKIEKQSQEDLRLPYSELVEALTYLVTYTTRYCLSSQLPGAI